MLLLIIIGFDTVTVLPELKSMTTSSISLTLIVRLSVNPPVGTSILELDPVTLIATVSADGRLYE